MKKLLTHLCIWYLAKQWGGQYVCIPKSKSDLDIPTYVRRGLKIDEVK